LGGDSDSDDPLGTFEVEDGGKSQGIFEFVEFPLEVVDGAEGTMDTV
jgi:hypothetical protein